jgi:hypothetical protein
MAGVYGQGLFDVTAAEPMLLPPSVACVVDPALRNAHPATGQ